MTFNKYYILAIVWASFILFATLASTGTLRDFHLGDMFAYDKPIHMFLFGMQAWLLIKARSLHAKENLMRIVFYACLISMLYGVFIEILQGILVLLMRSFDYLDMIADAIGCIIVYLWFWIKRTFHAKAQSQ